ncbi:hypothetical protein BHE90_008597 [Fusarium euwallaceae]|uniref:Uncharacterized protein n=2 Tax=Fusarium solani species complex TaxID=232080 RepID=A0A430LMI8_9HYPO|nr:hypothetical protein CEP51_013496 [Fusarium floridanum]RTE76924.1 hypothetical protein BHE90_008597 [Fusarium euwallaceae]
MGDRYVFQIPAWEGSDQFFAVINPLEREDLLPQHGESCTMFFPEYRTSSESDEDIEEELQALVHAFFHNVILPSRTAEDPLQFMLTAAADCLARELTETVWRDGFATILAPGAAPRLPSLRSLIATTSRGGGRLVW